MQDSIAIRIEKYADERAHDATLIHDRVVFRDDNGLRSTRRRSLRECWLQSREGRDRHEKEALAGKNESGFNSWHLLVSRNRSTRSARARHSSDEETPCAKESRGTSEEISARQLRGLRLPQSPSPFSLRAHQCARNTSLSSRQLLPWTSSRRLRGWHSSCPQ